ncbi:hypothetical protein IFU39_12850 [Paenibacillus sp. CFBP 13594]|uniref:phage tail terminator family protein n=1 Tax=Paenibacillus sp. CFBP 13594 TaxID=2774037 RepID=UPI00177F5F1F|nr:hypothetical protein [Paenibacillus sp. CFBP 13594]MBD8838707.1 hypothetical protein [Paenibacillus sp. CFBP 13594]
MITIKLTNSIAATLSRHLPNIPIHPASRITPEDQGLTYRLLAAKLTRERSDRFVQSHIFEIHWLDAREVPDNFPDTLFEALETIEVDGTPYRATELRWKAWGEAPKLWVYYTMRTTKVSEPSSTMQQMEQRPTELKSTQE